MYELTVKTDTERQIAEAIVEAWDWAIANKMNPDAMINEVIERLGWLEGKVIDF